MPLAKACEARQYSDEMHCGRCGLVWDVKDPDPPECKNKKDIAMEKVNAILGKP